MSQNKEEKADPLEDTIAALATPPGEGGIAVIRISGSEARAVTARIFRAASGRALDTFESHTVHLGEIREPSGEVVDQVLVTVFIEPNSYTGEDVIEIGAHGGMAVTRRILNLLYNAGARPAEPGEFTKRAFLNGRIDLTRAEAVIDLIRAGSDRSARVAARQLTGGLTRIFKELREELVKLMAHMEAFLDFPEEDIEVYEDAEMKSRLQELEARMKKLSAGFRRGALIREGARVLILGKPNVGKSSLFNALLERDRALVHDLPGTTRDHIEEALEIDGNLIRLQDTAGLAKAMQHPLDTMGMKRTREALEHADLILFVVDASTELSEDDRDIYGALPEGRPFLVIANKSDLVPAWKPAALHDLTGAAEPVFLSAVTREGFDQLEAAMIRRLGEAGVSAEDSEQLTRLRHKQGVETAREALARAREALDEKKPLECVVEDMRLAVNALRELIGEVYSEDLLDILFSEFCIGK